MRPTKKKATMATSSRGLAVVALVAAAALAGCGTETDAGGSANGEAADPGSNSSSESNRDNGGDGRNSAQDAAETGMGARGWAAAGFKDAQWIPERVTVDGEEYTRPAGDDRSYLTLRPGGAVPPADSGGESGGYLACNWFGTHVTFADDTINVGESVSTAVGCTKDKEGFANHFMDVFTGELTYEVDESGGRPGAPATLTLTNAAGDTIELTQSRKVIGDGDF